MSTATAATPGVIEATAIYTLREFFARTGTGPDTLRTARQRDPELVRRIGKRCYVVGAAWLRYVTTHGQ